ncbi:MAG: branched-chain amino acid ABC transporter permease [Proteobacteria bacterium]|nr:branched-chain amino acid ABC transporter permease [Pseudomonadota bacterium]MBU2468635.1 branched-chain amino acid ABC transporter permease [Pseudomonadota bacterium]MBU2517671.1 branched-chain amino acid ABC transporter permease [Pseudomonadota bacterium]
MGHYLRICYHVIKTEVLEVPGRVIAAMFVIALLAMPLFISQPYVLRILTLTAIFAIYATSWDVLAGFTGQVNLGHALFFGVAAYAGAKLNLSMGLPPWATIPLGGVVAVVVGLIAAMPALRLRGFYLSLVTMALPIILTGVIYIFPSFTGGELGLYGIDRLSNSVVFNYYLTTVIMLVSVYIMYKYTDSESKLIRTGIILHAIREDEITARASGINSTRYKIMAFAVSGFFAGIAGGLYGHYMKIVGPSTLDLFFSFQAILWTIFGGMTTIYGAVAGVYILYPLVEFIRVLPHGEDVRFIFFSGILILTLLFMPEGLTTWVRDKIEIKCPRCKLVNVVTRRNCRACRAPLHLEKDQLGQ